jgi:hypothetical protein
LFDSIDDLGWSEWQAFSECKGIPCSIGRQRRIRTCLNPPTITNRPSCDGDQIQERECQVACPKDSPSPLGVIVPTGLIDLQAKSTIPSSLFEDNGFSDWSPWTDCMGIPCRMGRQQRIRACLKPSITDGKKLICNGEQIQERDCLVPCSNKNSSSSSSVRPLSKGNDRFEK